MVGRGQGHLDVELDDVGHAQAVAAAPRVAAYSPTALWSSDLARARQTAAYVAKETGLDPVYDDRLREYDLGERTGLTLAEFADRFPAEHAALGEGRFEAVPGAESTERVRRRVVAALEDVRAALPSGETAVVVGHGAAMRVAVAALVGVDVADGAWLGGLGNCRWAVVEETPAGGRLRLTGYDLGR
jgi:broad specificity phosphatase PhoE